MDINQYRYLVTIAGQQSLSKAAEVLFISQPALSKTIDKAEQEVGVKLFDRSVTPIALTYAGELYIDEVKKILGIHETLNREMEKITLAQRGRVSLGIPGERGSQYLPHLLPAFFDEYPEVEVRILEEDSKTLEKELMKGNIEFAIYTLPVLSSDLAYEVICDDPILLSVPKNHPFCSEIDMAKNDPLHPHFLSPEKLEGENFILLEPGQGMRRTADLFFEKYAITPEILLTLKKNQTAYRLSTAGLGMAFIPLHTAIGTAAIETPGFFTVETPVYNRKVVVAYSKYAKLSDCARNFIDILKELIGSNPQMGLPLSLEELNQNIIF